MLRVGGRGSTASQVKGHLKMRDESRYEDVIFMNSCHFFIKEKCVHI